MRKEYDMAENSINDILTDEVEVGIEDLKGAEPRVLAEKIVNILDKKKASDIKLLSVNSRTVIADYFVIATANSSTQVKSLADEVEYKMGLCGVSPHHADGIGGGEWSVLDYSSVLVHVFVKSAREFYKLDKLWEDTTEIASTEENGEE